MGQMLPSPPTDAPVFIVDDDPAVRDALTLLLRIDGFSTRSFEDGPAFIEAIGVATPVCVILDLHLPGCSGLAVLKQLAEREGISQQIRLLEEGVPEVF